MPDLGAVVANNVRAERARLGWRQRELAERTGWSTDVVSDIETGKRRIGMDDVPVLCRALGVPLARLLVGADTDDLRVMGLS